MSEFVFLSGNFYKEKYPLNTPYDFTVELPRALSLTPQWSVGLSSLYLSGDLKPGLYYLQSSVCKDSNVCNRQMPILRTFYINENPQYFTFQIPFYLPISDLIVNKITLQLFDSLFKPVRSKDASEASLHAVIHFRDEQQEVV